MWKKALLRGLLGFPLGVFISATISLIISLILGVYSPTVPAFAEACGGVLQAAVWQYLFSGLMGLGWSAASVVWEKESWSLARQTAFYFSVGCLCTLPFSFVANWMPHSVGGVLGFIGIFVGMFAFIWFICYFTIRARIKRINEKLEQRDNE